MRKGAEQNVMVDVNYRQGRDGTTLETVVQDLYLCASMEFLLTVADIFLKAMAQGFSSPPKSSKQASTSTKDAGIMNCGRYFGMGQVIGIYRHLKLF